MSCNKTIHYVDYAYYMHYTYFKESEVIGMKEISALDLRKKFGEVLDEVRYKKEPCVVKKNGRAVVVIVDFEAYRASQENLRDEAFIELYTDERMKEFVNEDKMDRKTAEVVRKKLNQ